jgi:hypothetical protein
MAISLPPEELASERDRQHADFVVSGHDQLTANCQRAL